MASEVPNSETQALIDQTDFAIKQVELKLKERELATPTSTLSKLKVSAAEATVFVGVLAFLGTFAGTYLQESNKLALKEREQESALILEALKGDDPARNLSRLRLLIEAGFITDKNETIRTIILSGKYGDVAAPSPPTLLDAMAKGVAPALLREIIRVVGVTPAVELREQVNFTPIAAVTKQNGRMVLYYDKEQVGKFDRASSNSWTAPAILAHEIGHVVLGHMDRKTLCFTAKEGTQDCVQHRVLELEADRFAGQVLRLLGASLEQAEQAIAFLPDAGGPTHPGRQERLQAMLKGWKG